MGLITPTSRVFLDFFQPALDTITAGLESAEAGDERLRLLRARAALRADAGDEAGVVESVKAASDVYMPVSGEVLEVNEALVDEPETINSAPYDNGWLFKLQPSGDELEDLMDADAYQAEIED